jgi:hypothetical protein
LKESIMKRIISLATLLIACLLTTKTFASDPVGIYALIDRVVLEPSDAQPERIKIQGAFCFAVRNFGDQYSPPVRGYLYYQLPAKKADAAKAEWADMRKIAGTQQIIAFGSRYQPFGKLHRGAGPAAPTDVPEKERVLGELQPDPYPIGFGLDRVRGDQNSDHVRQLRNFPAAFSPADGAVVDAGAITLVAANIAAADSQPKYFFEIENAADEKESSAAIQQAERQTEWSPKMQLKPGEKYTWRVWVDDGKSRGPVAEAAFVARATRP